jgi:dienelactone hydrolase
MHHSLGYLIPLAVALTAPIALCELPARRPATQPANAWNAAAFAYESATPLVIEETTPTAAEVEFYKRPPQMPKDIAAPKAASAAARPRSVGPVDIVHLRFRDERGDDVPLLLCKPAGKAGAFPVVIALHGVGSNKAQVCGQVAPALAKRGFAVLAPDLPLHGERPGDPRQFLQNGDLVKLASVCRQSVIDLRQCIDVAEARPDLETRHGVLLAGYSLGALIDSVAGPADPRVKGMLLMVGGTIDFPPAFALLPDLCALQPQLAIPNFAGRPLLMLNGREDRTITREMGERLFAAAAEPKEQKWYESGHLLPKDAYEDGAAWLAQTWKSVNAKK